jgi:hypothetical protein
VLALLPWYVSGALAEEERALVAAHLDSCASCERELAALERVGAAVRSEQGEPSFDLSRLGGVLARLPAQAPARWWVRAATQLREALATPWAETPVWARAALATQVAALLVLTAALVAGPREGSDRESHTAAGGDCAVEACVALAFAADAREAEMRALLEREGARIVDGPSSLGLYTVSLGEMDAQAADAAIARLRERTDVVRSAERAQ